MQPQNPHLLHTLYASASAKYFKLRRRYEKRLRNKTFKQLTKRKQYALIQQLKKLYERLKSLHALLRTVAAGSVVALALSATEVNAQTLGPFVRNDAENPLPPPVERLAVPRPAAVDIDDDGDLDVFVGDKYGNIYFYRNNGGPDGISKLNLETAANPFAGVDVGSRAVVSFADVDADGDYDALVGNYDGYTFFYRNSSATTPEFTLETGGTNPFDGITGSFSPTYGRRPALPSFADIDGDGDTDLVIGSRFIDDEIDGDVQSIHVFTNTGGIFTESSNAAFADLFDIEDPTLTFAHLNTDDDIDILVGSRFGVINTFLNNGTSFVQQSGEWDADSRTGNIGANIYPSSNSAPFFADFDGDGDLDLLVGSGSSYSRPYNTELTRFYENTDGDFTLVRLNGLNQNPFEGVDVGGDARPAFVDIDNDGDIDAILGNKYEGNLEVYINENGKLTRDPDHPLSDPELGFGTTPVFVDIDDDGDLDLFVPGTFSILLLENTGEEFVQTQSPLDPEDGSNFNIAFVDIDDDGDYDAFVTMDDFVGFYENIGSANNAIFTPATTPAPFNNFDFKYGSDITAVDFDNDGDRDIVLSATVYDFSEGFMLTEFAFFENDNGAFTQLPDDTFDEVTAANDYLNFGDVDGDGDLDIFIGHGSNHGVDENGRIRYFENQNPAPVTEITQTTINGNGNQPFILAPTIEIEDTDNDDIVQANIWIEDFSEGDAELAFTPQHGITGSFDDETGVLTLHGKASRENYEDALQSVTLNYTGNIPEGRKAARQLDLTTTVTFEVRDIDFTLTTVSIVTVILAPGDPLEDDFEVFNAISPGVTSGQNDHMQINGLPAENKVTILNRWGDKVFEVSGYDNETRRFEGKSDNGKDLPSGTYYYIIEVQNRKITGYLSLKR